LKTKESEKITEITTLNENMKTYNSNLTKLSKEKEELSNFIKNLETESIEANKQENKNKILQSIFKKFYYLKINNNKIIRKRTREYFRSISVSRKFQ